MPALPEKSASSITPHLLIQRSGRPMATDVSVQIATIPEQIRAAREAADACMRWFDEVDTHLSRFQPESELSRLNRVPGSWYAVSELLYSAAHAAVSAAETTDGRFDPTLLHQLEALGYDRDFAEIAQREVPAMPQKPVTPAHAAWRSIEFDPQRRRIRLPANVGLDLGGIAKGWAADLALNRFCLPFTGALINVGGDLRVRGGPVLGESWSVGIRDPRYELPLAETDPAQPIPEKYLALLNFSRGGLATSGAVRRWWLRNGQRQHHLLDPQTGDPIPLWMPNATHGIAAASTATAANADDTNNTKLIATVTALAPTAAHAEVAAKLALLRGYPQALRAVEAAWERPILLGVTNDVDTPVALMLTFGDGTYQTSSNLPAYLATWGSDGVSLSQTITLPSD